MGDVPLCTCSHQVDAHVVNVAMDPGGPFPCSLCECATYVDRTKQRADDLDKLAAFDPDLAERLRECARCDTVPAPEFCWYCHRRLCLECWEGIGHCGHPEADAENARARERGAYAE